MERKTNVLICQTVESIPPIENILATPRETKLKIVFEGHMQEHRQAIGQQWKRDLPNFFIGIHMIDPEINIAKLITKEEIRENQLFFELCAIEYYSLASQLIQNFADHLNEIIDPTNPMNTFGKYKMGKQRGAVGRWSYCFHGAHCGFTHQKTGQYIEVALIYGLEYGALDPYFFSRYILSTQAYKPLPADIYEEYQDGQIILAEMVTLGRFEKISTGIAGNTCIVVARG